MPAVGVLSAFFGGFISFISPCVLPLIPGYLSFITGISADQLEDPTPQQRRLIISRAVIFSLGFTIVFTILGATASSIVSPLGAYRRYMELSAGILIIIVGLMVSGILKSSLMQTFEKRVSFKGNTSSSLGSFLLGMAFAVAWTPCVGPILGAILFYAGSSGLASTGAVLLLVYSLGLAIPLILTAIVFSRMLSLFGWIKKRYQVIMAVSGGFLVIMGLMLIFGQFSYFNIVLQKVYNQFNINFF